MIFNFFNCLSPVTLCHVSLRAGQHAPPRSKQEGRAGQWAGHHKIFFPRLWHAAHLLAWQLSVALATMSARTPAGLVARIRAGARTDTSVADRHSQWKGLLSDAGAFILT
jgi:hypothetical protein